MTGALSPTHWAIIAVVVLLLFGAKRLPDAARGLGTSMRIFKAETSSLAGKNEQGAQPDRHADDPTESTAATPSHEVDPAHPDQAVSDGRSASVTTTTD